MAPDEQDREQLANFQAHAYNKPASHESDMAQIQREREDREKEIFSSDNWDKYYESGVDSQGRAIVPDKAKTWNWISDTVAAQNSRGEKYITPYDEDRIKELRAIGYEKNERMSVPYANEQPTHPDAKARWQALVNNRNAKNKA